MSHTDTHTQTRTLTLTLTQHADERGFVVVDESPAVGLVHYVATQTEAHTNPHPDPQPAVCHT